MSVNSQRCACPQWSAMRADNLSSPALALATGRRADSTAAMIDDTHPCHSAQRRKSLRAVRLLPRMSAIGRAPDIGGKPSYVLASSSQTDRARLRAVPCLFCKRGNLRRYETIPMERGGRGGVGKRQGLGREGKGEGQCTYRTTLTPPHSVFSPNLVVNWRPSPSLIRVGVGPEVCMAFGCSTARRVCPRLCRSCICRLYSMWHSCRLTYVEIESRYWLHVVYYIVPSTTSFRSCFVSAKRVLHFERRHQRRNAVHAS